MLAGAGVGIRAEAKLDVAAGWGIGQDCRCSMQWDGGFRCPPIPRRQGRGGDGGAGFVAAALALPSKLV